MDASLCNTYGVSMKLLTQTIIATALLGPLLATPAHADGWYVKASVGQSGADVGPVTLNDGFAYDLAAGTAVGPVRVEGGVARLSGDLAGALQANALDYHANAYLDLPVGDNASVFGGVGLDYIDGEANFGFGSIDASGNGWNWAVGGAYRLNDRMIAEVQYRDVTADLDTPFGGADLDAQVATIGVRMRL